MIFVIKEIVVDIHVKIKILCFFFLFQLLIKTNAKLGYTTRTLTLPNHGA